MSLVATRRGDSRRRRTDGDARQLRVDAARRFTRVNAGAAVSFICSKMSGLSADDHQETAESRRRCHAAAPYCRRCYGAGE